MNRGLPPWQRECMQDTEQAGEMCSGTNTGAEVKTPPGPTPSSLLGKGVRGLSPHPASTWRLESAQPPGSSQRRGAEDSTAAGMRCPCTPGQSPAAPVKPKAPQHPPIPAPPGTPILHIFHAPLMEAVPGFRAPHARERIRETPHWEICSPPSPEQTEKDLK